MNIAIIPARAGSKRIPRKNIRPFAGKPMIEWPITAALESGLFERVIVSTDSAEIADIAKHAGAEAPFVRPPELSDDHAGTIDVVVHALNWAVEAEWEVEAACCIYATAAFLEPADLAEAHALLGPDCEYSFSAVRFGHPPQRGFLRDESGAPVLLNPEYRATRTQDLPPVFHDAGQFYWGTREAWLEKRPFFGETTRFIELPATRAQDIDRIEDWDLAERLFLSLRADS